MDQQSPVVWHVGALTLTQHTLVIEGLFGGSAAKAEWDFSIFFFLQPRKMGGGLLCLTITGDEQF